MIGRYVIYGGSHGMAFGQCSPSFLLLPLRMSVIWQARHKRTLKISIFILRYWQSIIFSEYICVQGLLAVPISVCKLRPQVPFLTNKIQNRRILDWFWEGKMPTSTHKSTGVFQLYSSKLATKVTEKVFFELKFRQVCCVELQ